MAENLTPKKYINDNNIKQILTTVKNKIPNISECVTEEQLLAKDYATKTYVGEQIANIEHLKREIITILPSDEEASDNVIYMLKIESATGNDKYQEYMKIDGTVQMIGDTSVDLTDYAKTADIPTTVAELADSADYAKKTDLHSHTNKAVLDNITTEKIEAWDNPEDSIARNPEYEVPAIKSKLVSGESIGDALGKISKVIDDYVDGNLGGSEIWAGSSADFESQQDSIPVETTILIEDDLPDGSFVDSTLNILSENPVQNKVITKAINDTNTAVNVLNENLTADNGLVFNFASDEDGNYGMKDSEGNFMAFGGGGNITDFIKEGILSLCGISQYTSNNNGFNLGVISPGLYLFGIFSRNSAQVLNGITGGTAIKTIQGKTSDNYTSYEIGLLFSYGDGYVTTNITTNASSSSYGVFNLFAIPIMPYCANVDYAQLYRESKISLDIDNAIINVNPTNTTSGLTLEQTIGKGKFLIITFAGMNNSTETTHTVTYSDCSVLTNFKQGTTISSDRGNSRTAYEASIVDGLSDSSKVSYYSKMDGSNDNSRVIIAIPIRNI